MSGRKSFSIAMAAVLLLSHGCQANTRAGYGARGEPAPAQTPAPSWDDAELTRCEPGDGQNYTVMVYMNGSDLESENGAATADILEMIGSGADDCKVNVVIFTGGAIQWRNDTISADECAVWRVRDGGLEKLGGVGLLNMGDPDTLAGFVNYAADTFPAKRYGLILWDHGGGSIAGYGHDELFGNSRLSLSELDDALARSAREKKLAFIGFDACLMASVEMAVVASRYADYMVASEDLEPNEGWDYGFLAALGEDAGMDGEAAGRLIADGYFDFYGGDTDEGLTLSVARLSEARGVMDALGALTARCSEELRRDRSAFRPLARRRGKTKSFGNGSRRDDDCDMVDIGDMAAQLSDLFPDEAQAVAEALRRAVAYQRNNSEKELGGLTAFYIYGGGDRADSSLSTYAGLNLNQDYTGYLRVFADMMGTPARAVSAPSRSGAAVSGAEPETGDDSLLSAHLTVWKSMPNARGLYYMAGKREAEYAGEKAAPDDHLRWPALNGVFVCLDRTDRSAGGEEYAVPVRINGRDADIIILFCEKYPDGKVMGARHEDGFIIQKGLDPIEDGDVISFYRRVLYLGGPSKAAGGTSEGEADEWRLGGQITVRDGLRLTWHKQRGACRYSFMLTDWRRAVRYTEFVRSQEG